MSARNALAMARGALRRRSGAEAIYGRGGRRQGCSGCQASSFFASQLGADARAPNYASARRPCSGVNGAFRCASLASRPVARSEGLPAPAGTPCSLLPSSCAASRRLPREQGLYRRPLERQDTVSFSSEAGQQMLVESITAGHAAAYFPLAEQFITQSSPPLCGPATVAMILNSLAVDPQRVWKAPWRWYSEEMLMACTPQDWSNGISMHEFAHLAECNGTVVRMFRAGGPGAGLEDFRNCVRRVCAEDAAGSRLAVNFSRARLDQTGDGHYSPIGAYSASRDAALVMDVARFKYPPFWVPLPVLWEAMLDVDASEGRSRGFFEIRKAPHELQALTPCGSTCKPSEGPRVGPAREPGDQTLRELLTVGLPNATSLDPLCMVSCSQALGTLLDALLAHADVVVQELRPLSHFVRMQLVQKPQVTERALGQLRETLVPPLLAREPRRSRMEALWPSHPQIAVELTALLILACAEHLSPLEPFAMVLRQALTSAPRETQQDRAAHARLCSLIGGSARVLGLQPEAERSGFSRIPCRDARCTELTL